MAGCEMYRMLALCQQNSVGPGMGKDVHGTRNQALGWARRRRSETINSGAARGFPPKH